MQRNIMDEEANDTLAKQLRAARDGAGISLLQLEELTGIPRGHLARIEAGVSDLRMEQFFRIARALGKTPKDFF